MRSHIELNPIDCVGHGVCADLLPERIQLDDWGYPIIDRTDLTPDQVAHAKRAVTACPTLALRLERSTGPR